MNAATSLPARARSRASASLYGTTMVSPSTAAVIPAVAGTPTGLSAGPARSSEGFMEIMTSSWWPWYPPSTFTILSRPVTPRATRIASMVASVPELVNRHIGRS